MSHPSPKITLPDYPAELQADPRDLPYDKAQLTRFYVAMKLARTFEEKLGALYRQGKVNGAVYLGMGQEATSVGSVSALKDGDFFTTVARNLSAFFYKGIEPRDVMARWMGKDIPPSNGRELGLFLADIKNFGIPPYHNGSMASWIPSGAGYALAFKLRKQPNVMAAFTGDGATSPGDFYEGLNFAAIHKLPLVIICEVNQFAYSTSIAKQMPVVNVADRAPAFNIYAETHFGNDLFLVIEAAQRGIEHARSGKGPALIEFKTFRQRGHGEHDDMAYVPEELRDFWAERDPIKMYREWLLKRASFTTSELESTETQVEADVESAITYAESLPMPKPESVTERLFAPSPHDPDPNQAAPYEPIDHPSIPGLTAAQDKSEGGHF